MSDEVTEVIENLKIEFPRLQRWDNIKIITHFCENWKNTDTLRNARNEKILGYSKESELKEREKENPDNDIKVEITEANNKVFDSLLEDQSGTLDWEKAVTLMIWNCLLYTSPSPRDT